MLSGRRVLSLLAGIVSLVVSLAAGLGAPDALAQSTPAAPTTTAFPGGVPAAAWALVDAGTGDVLDARDLHTPRLVASTVKIVTALTVARLLEPNDTLVVSPVAITARGNQVPMKAGETWTVENALWALLLESKNDAAYALAERAGGSLDGFAREMAVTATKLGMVDSTFADPAGLNGRDTPVGDSLMSPYDLAVAARAVLAHPLLGPMVGTVSHPVVLPDGTIRTFRTENKQLRDTSRHYDGAIGVKTGFTRAAGGTFVSAAKREGRTLIAVALNTAAIYDSTAMLLDRGFATAAGTARVAQLPSPTTTSMPSTSLGAEPVGSQPTVTSAVATAAEGTSEPASGLPIALVALAASSGVLLASHRAAPRVDRRRRHERAIRRLARFS